MTKNYVLKAETGYVNISPYGFWYYANDYLDAGINWINHQSENRYSPVPYFLFCRAIELGLKSYLILQGIEIDFIKKKLRHDLIKILKKAQENSLSEIKTISNEEFNEIEKANSFYDLKGFEYFFISNHVEGLAKHPDLKILEAFAKDLLIKLYKPVIDA